MHQVIIAVISSIFGGAVTAFYGYKGKQVASKTDGEKTYAEYSSELFDRIDKLTQERDRSAKQVIKLQSKVDGQDRTIKEQTATIHKLEKKVDEQSAVIDRLNKQIGEMSTKLDALGKLEKEEINNDETN